MKKKFKISSSITSASDYSFNCEYNKNIFQGWKAEDMRKISWHVTTFTCLVALRQVGSSPLETCLASLRLQHHAIGTLVLPSPFVGVCSGTAAGLGCPCLAMCASEMRVFRPQYWISLSSLAGRYVADCINISLQIFSFLFCFSRPPWSQSSPHQLAETSSNSFMSPMPSVWSMDPNPFRLEVSVRQKFTSFLPSMPTNHHQCPTHHHHGGLYIASTLNHRHQQPHSKLPAMLLAHAHRTGWVFTNSLHHPFAKSVIGDSLLSIHIILNISLIIKVNDRSGEGGSSCKDKGGWNNKIRRINKRRNCMSHLMDMSRAITFPISSTPLVTLAAASEDTVTIVILKLDIINSSLVRRVRPPLWGLSNQRSAHTFGLCQTHSQLAQHRHHKHHLLHNMQL